MIEATKQPDPWAIAGTLPELYELVSEERLDRPPDFLIQILQKKTGSVLVFTGEQFNLYELLPAAADSRPPCEREGRP